ncbi:MAG: HEAT repeat domain-containing protein [Anaerolineaceae bacterium]|nr:HEAT repeat domain-containing protein [Anaerolineaceae bacterium]
MVRREIPTPPAITRYIEHGEAALILDGLDELGSSRPINPQKPEEGTYDPRQRFMAQVQWAVDSGNDVLITCRVKDYAAIGELFAEMGAVQLHHLNDDQIRGYLNNFPTVQTAVMDDTDLLDICRSPLLLRLIAFGYRDAPADLQGLGSLQAGALRDAIFSQYITTSYNYEARRRADQGKEMPFALEKVLEVLGHAAMINVCGGTRDDGTGLPGSYIAENVLVRHDFSHHIEDSEIDTFCALARELHILYKRDDETHGFLHLLLRDHLAYAYSMTHLEDATIYPESVWHPSPAKALGGLGDSRAVAPLMAALADTDKWVHHATADALGKLLDDIRDIESLITALRAPDASVRCVAARALGKLGDPRAITHLITALADTDIRVRSFAAGALGELGDACAVEPLITALAGTNWFVRCVAAGALGKLGDPRAITHLITALAEPNSDVRSAAADALGKLGDPRAIAPLITALADMNVDVRSAAADALGKLGDPALQPLLRAFGHGNAYVRNAAAKALGQLGDPRTVDPLITALADTNWFVSSATAEALGKLGDPRAVDPLITTLADMNAAVRSAAALALGQLGDPRAVSALAERLADTDWTMNSRVCVEAARALQQIGTPEALAAVEEWERNGRGRG